MNWNIDCKHHTFIIEFDTVEEAKTMMKNFSNNWDSDRDGLRYRLDLESVFVCNTMFCVYVEPWSNTAIPWDNKEYGINQFEKFLRKCATGDCES
jgi:hypothetical protein